MCGELVVGGVGGVGAMGGVGGVGGVSEASGKDTSRAQNSHIRSCTRMCVLGMKVIW